MANSCSNSLMINGDNIEDVKQIINLFSEIHRQIPRKELTLYNQLCVDDDDFGTKWIEIASDYAEEECAVDMQLYFDTAWGPSLELTHKLSKLFPNIEFNHQFCESGNDIGGCYIYKNGECVQEEDTGYIEYLKNYDSEGYDAELNTRLDNSKLLQAIDTHTKTLNPYELNSDLESLAFREETVSKPNQLPFFNIFFANYKDYKNDDYLDDFLNAVIIPCIITLFETKKITKKEADRYQEILKSPDPENHTIVYELINLKFNS